MLCYNIVYKNAEIVPMESCTPRYRNLQGDLVIPNKVIYRGQEYEVVAIGERAFLGCESLESVIIPNTITRIDDYAFWGCSNLSRIDIPASVKKIGKYCFSKCTAIQILNIPKEVTTIGEKAFTEVKNVSYSGKAEGSPWGAKALNGLRRENGEAQNNKSSNLISEKNQRDLLGRPSNNTKQDTIGNRPPLGKYTEKWCQRYFQKHIEDLDPIEGIYDVHSITHLYGKKDFHIPMDAVVAIIKSKANIYEIKHIWGNEGGNFGIDACFERLGETPVYKYTSKMSQFENQPDGSKKTVGYIPLSARVVLSNYYVFEFSVEYPMAYFPNNHDFKGGGVEYSLIKKYPTGTMYEAVIPTIEPQGKGTEDTQWSGTGWALGNGYVVTNYHVAEDAKAITIKGIKGNHEKGYSATVVATDKTNDLAVLRINDPNFTGYGTVPYGISTRMADKGESIFVMGYPYTQILGDEVKYTTGEINSRTGYQGEVNTYQISAQVDHGSSGGPMFDSKGNVIGIIVGGTRITENTNYAIKTSYLKILVESAGINVPFQTNNTISTLSTPDKIKRIENYVFYIECSK